jgi:hypothetical protein
MKVDGSMADVSQKIDREGTGSGFVSAKMAERELSPADPALRQYKTPKACGTSSDGAMGCPEARVIKEIPVIRRIL